MLEVRERNFHQRLLIFYFFLNYVTLSVQSPSANEDLSSTWSEASYVSTYFVVYARKRSPRFPYYCNDRGAETTVLICAIYNAKPQCICASVNVKIQEDWRRCKCPRRSTLMRALVILKEDTDTLAIMDTSDSLGPSIAKLTRRVARTHLGKDMPNLQHRKLRASLDMVRLIHCVSDNHLIQCTCIDSFDRIAAQDSVCD
jgi:hypothetical protein